MSAPTICIGVDIGERNFGYAIAIRTPPSLFRVIRMGTKDFKGDTVQITCQRMIRWFHSLIQEFEGQKLIVSIELQGKLVAKNRIYQHIISTYIDTREIVGKSKWMPESRFITPTDKFRVSAEGGKLKLLARSEVEVVKTHGNRKKEAIQRAKQVIPLLLERPEEALAVQDGMNDHMADALLTALYTLLRIDDPTLKKKKRPRDESDYGTGGGKKGKSAARKPPTEYAQWSF